MKIKIIADSTCDLSKDLLEKYDISLVPLYISMGNKTFKDGVEVTPDDIYDYVSKTGNLAKTAAPNIDDYIKVFRHWNQLGYQIMCFCISKDCSSSYQNACVAANEFDDIYVVDTRNLSTGEGLVVLYGADMIKEGYSAEEVQSACNEAATRVEASFVVDSIDFLHKGGRCSALAAFGANLLKLKPGIDVVDGKMKPSKKYRGNIDKVILDYVNDRLAGRDDIIKNRIFITHTGCKTEVVERIKEKINKIAPDFKEVIETRAGCTVTTHCGPNTLGVLFIRKGKL